MKIIAKAIVAWLLLGATALAATLLPPGRQVFLNANGAPLVGGFVYFYQAGSHTFPKTTWKDAGQTQPNTNPVQLDQYGSATIYGSGAYQEVVTDYSGAVIWDQQTADTSFTSNSWLWGGTSTGSANAQIISLTGFSNTTGQLVSFIAGFTNNSQLSVNGFNVVKDTAAGPVSLSGGEVTLGNSVTLNFDPILQQFHMVEPSTYPPLWGGGVTTLASAGTTDLCLNAPNAFINITGTTTITSFGSSCLVGQMKMVQFTGALTINNSASLVLPNGANYAAAAGSWAIFTYTATNTWQMSYPYTVSQPPQTTWLTSGSGTYTVPALAKYLEIELCGGGSGGGGSGTSGTGGASSAGGDTTFGAGLTTHGGALAPTTGVGTVPTPATATGGDINIVGGLGGSPYEINTAYIHGSGANRGASSRFGDGGLGGSAAAGPVIISPSNGTGFCSGGGGGGWGSGVSNPDAGWGGNAGAYLFKRIVGPAATYAYAIGAGSAGGAAGTGGTTGGAGTNGLAKITAYFQ